MADLFISYSRRDEPFVERLREALGKRDRDVWLDREDIGPAVEWRREIELGIEGADVFAFVISPDALRSEPCRREREYAVTKNKRIVPLLRREPEEISVPQDLASRNYIFFRTDEEFDPGVVSLLAAIEDLPEWARDHTRLLQRAEQWERSDRDPSFLLRGSDLTEAERWLSEQAAHKEPRPTPLQTEYLLASRKAATRRQRITIGAVGLALAVSVILGLVAVLQRNEAVRQAQLAKSRELAATSDAAVRTDPWEALELATEAAETSTTPEATGALRGALEAPRESAVLELPGNPIKTASFIDSAHVLTTTIAGHLQRWNLATEDYVSVGRQTTFGSALAPTNQLSPDGGLRITAAINGVRVSDARSGTRLIGLDRLGGGVEGAIRGAQFSPDGRSFLTVGYDGRVQIWPLGFTLLGEREAAAGAITEDGGRCLTADLKVTVAVWSCASGEKLWSRRLPAPNGVTLDGDSLDADFSADGAQVVVSTGLSTTVIDAESGQELSQLRGSPGLGVSPTISPSGLLALRALADDRAEVIGLPEENQIRTLPVDLSFGRQVVFSDNDRRVVTWFRQDPVVQVWGLPSDPVVPIKRPEGPTEDVDLSADGSILLTAGGSSNSTSTLERWDAASGERVGAFTTSDYVFTAAFAADERFVVTGGVVTAESDGTARVWETLTGRPVAAYPVDREPPVEASLSADGRLLAVRAHGAALVFDCPACHPSSELLDLARAELERRPASVAPPAGT